jgi:hypothetical protein
MLRSILSLKIGGWQLLPNTVKGLILLNIGLQVFDGLASYKGVQLGIPEGNPWVVFLTEQWGLEWALFVLKGGVCAILLAMSGLRHHPWISVGLAITAALYFVVSFLSWILFLVVHGI